MSILEFLRKRPVAPKVESYIHLAWRKDGLHATRCGIIDADRHLAEWEIGRITSDMLCTDCCTNYVAVVIDDAVAVEMPNYRRG